MTSMTIEQAIYYCGGHFNECEIYKKWEGSSGGVISPYPGVPGLKPTTI